jgi:phage baseplate assembly protein W
MSDPSGYDPSDFIGRGISFPLRVDQSGSIAMTRGIEDIDSSIRMVLTTAPGERLMRPQFGCRIWELLFEPINANTLGLMGEAVREAIGRWEPRVELDDVRLDPGNHHNGEVFIHVDYTVRTTNDRRNLVYPFYVIPREDD